MPTNRDFIFPYRQGQRKQPRGYPADPAMRAEAIAQEPPRDVLVALTKAAAPRPKRIETSETD